MRKTLTAAALVLTFSCHAGAGVIHIPPAPEPEPAQTLAAQEPTVTDEDGGTTNALTQAALDLLAVLPSLF